MSRARYCALKEKPILNLGKFHGLAALLVIVRRAVDPRAHGIAPQPRIVGLQEFGSERWPSRRHWCATYMGWPSPPEAKTGGERPQKMDSKFDPSQTTGARATENP
ncbi:MAG: hypothetical protein WCB11_15275 [Terriglobales bacterium]